MLPGEGPANTSTARCVARCPRQRCCPRRRLCPAPSQPGAELGLPAVSVAPGSPHPGTQLHGCAAKYLASPGSAARAQLRRHGTQLPRVHGCSRGSTPEHPRARAAPPAARSGSLPRAALPPGLQGSAQALPSPGAGAQHSASISSDLFWCFFFFFFVVFMKQTGNTSAFFFYYYYFS